MNVLGVHEVSFTYVAKTRTAEVLRGCTMSVASGESVAIMGPSGTGKTTLLHCIAGLLRPDAGKITLDDERISGLSATETSDVRRGRIGMAFQVPHLLRRFSSLENTAMPLLLEGYPRVAALDLALGALREVGLGDRASHDPSELSGGEAQRVALARAIVRRPRLLIADEPTGNLDDETTGQVLDVLDALRAVQVAAVLIATHDPVVAARCDRRVRMTDGQIVEE